ncbi:hypothetical protein BC830DRAFT_1080286 [Chytriomyces sp. MP71]|nr:hypothetical protein BC830DRAFT_1080286 [Chytriomyces sp. MP71]
MGLPSYLPGLHSCHVVALGTLTGMVLHTTFVNSIIQYQTLSKSIFGHLQNAQFPPYFAIGSACALFLTASTARLGGFASLPAALSASGAGAFQTKLMAAAALGSVANWLWVGPVTTRVMLERKELVKKGAEVQTKEMDAINWRFGAWHSVSSTLNLILVVASVWNCVWVGDVWAEAVGLLVGRH